MARARELWLILRARNEATGAIRAAARGMRGLQEGPQVLQRQQQDVMNQITKAQRMRDQYRDQQRISQEGSKNLQQQIRAARFDEARVRHGKEIIDNEKQAARSVALRGKEEVRLMQLQRQRRYGTAAGVPRMTAAQLDKSIAASKEMIRSHTLALGANAKAVEINRMAVTRLSIEEAKLAAMEREAAAAAITQGRMADEQALRIRSLGARSRELNQALKDVPTDRIQALGGTLRGIGRTMAITGAVVIGAFGLMAKQAADFNREVMTAATQVTDIGAGADAVVRNAGKIQEAVLSQMEKFPATGQDMTDTLYNIYSSMNVTFGQGTKLLELFNQAWVAGGLKGNLIDVSNALITVANNWHINAGNMEAFRKITASTMATVRFGRMTLDQYTTTMNQLAPAFHGAHQSILTMNSAIAFMTRQLPSTRMSAAGLARLMELFARMADPLEAAGAKITDSSGNLLELDQIIGILIKRFPDLQTSGTYLTNFFKTIGGQQGTIQARRAFQALILGHKDYQKVVKDITKDVKEFDRSQKALSEAPSVRFMTFQNQLRVMEIEIGSALIPVFAELGKIVKGVTDAWNSLSPSMQHSIAQFLAWGAVATLVIGLLTSLAGIILGTVVVWRSFGSSALIAVRALTGVRGEGGLLAGALRLLRGETGTTMVGFAKFSGVLTALVVGIPLLVQVTGSLGAALGIVSSALGVWVAARWLPKLLAMIVGVGRLKTALLGVTATPYVIAITLAYIGAKAIAKNIENLQKQYLEAEGRTIDLTTKPQQRFINTLGKQINQQRAAGKSMADILHDLDVRLGGGLQAKDIEAAAIRRSVQLRTPEGRRAAARTEAAAQDIGPFTNREFLSQMRMLNRLNSAIETAPNLAAKLRAITKYNAAVKDAAGRETKDQKAAQDQILQALQDGSAAVATVSTRRLSQVSQRLHTLQAQFALAPTMGMAKQIQRLQAIMEKATPAQKAYFDALQANMGISDKLATSTFNKLRQLQAQFRVKPTMGLAEQIQRLQAVMEQASPAQQAFFQQLEQNLGAVKIVSDRSVLTMARNVARLRRAFEAAPSTKTYQAWYEANKRFTTLATQDQQDFANATIEANKAATQKIQENFNTVLSQVRSMYNEILQANQAAFGTLGTGPFVKRLEELASAKKDVSAVVGNLIDWGLMAKPDLDKLNKRLQEHRLTPKEIIADLRSQVGAFRRWNHDLDAIRRRGAPRALIAQLRQLGPEFEPMLRGVLKMSPGQFRTYVGLFNKGQKDVHNQTMVQLRAQLRLYRRFGRNIANAISAGIQDENASLRRAFVHLMRTTFPGLRIPGGRDTPRRPPARTTRRQRRRPAAAPRQTRTTQRAQPAAVVHYHYHADSAHQMTPQAYFQKMHFRQRNQRRC